ASCPPDSWRRDRSRRRAAPAPHEPAASPPPECSRPEPSRHLSATGGGAPRGDAATRVDLVELDHVVERILHEDLLRLRAHHTLRDPVLHAEAIQLLAGLVDVGDGQRYVRQRRILARALGELRLTVDAHEMDLRRASDVHPVPIDGRDVRTPGIVVEAEHVAVERACFRDLLLRGADADPVMMQLEHFNGHGTLLSACPRCPWAETARTPGRSHRSQAPTTPSTH